MAVIRRSEAQSRADYGVVAVERVGSAVRFAGGVAAAGVAFVVVAALWVSTCTVPSDMDAAACGVPQRTLLGLGAPTILFGGTVWSFICAYRIWRAREDFWAWQGAGWFLLTVTLVTLAVGFPPLAGTSLVG